MIIIEKYWEEPDPQGGCNLLNKVERKAFDNDNLKEINEFINNSQEMTSDYELYNIKYKYIKL